jgi:hypothetical protein
MERKRITHMHTSRAERGGSEFADGDERVALEENDFGWVRAGGQRDDGARFDFGIARGYDVQGVRMFAIGEGVEGIAAVCAESGREPTVARPTRVDGVHV